MNPSATVPSVSRRKRQMPCGVTWGCLNFVDNQRVRLNLGMVLTLNTNAMYKIIGGDKKEYGPVEMEVLREWLVQGRVNAQTLIKPEGGGDWQPLSAYPELAELTGVPSQPPEVIAPSPGGGLAQEIVAADYDLDIGGCVSDAWNAFSRNFGLVLGGAAIYLLIQGGLSGMAYIRVIKLLIIPVMLIVTGPLLGGFYYFLLKNLRGQPIEVGDVFAGFKTSFGQLIAGHLVPAIIAFLAALPGVVVVAIPAIQMFKSHQSSPLMWLAILFGTVLILIPSIYLGICWAFTVPLIIDKQLDFWTAMGMSRKKVSQHWWNVFGLAVVAGLIYIAGVLACCVGVFCTLPVAAGTLLAAYERIFNGRLASPTVGPPAG